MDFQSFHILGSNISEFDESSTLDVWRFKIFRELETSTARGEL